MVIYFTFQETPDASIFKTQIIDVVSHLQENFTEDVRLLAFLPVRSYFKNRRKIKDCSMVKSYIWPQLPFPRMYAWRWNILFLWLFYILIRPRNVICRNIFATWLTIKVKPFSFLSKVVFDSRGIITEEAREYGVYPSHIIPQIEHIESFCVNYCDMMMVITQRMADYYQKRFGYEKKNYVVIPCTLGTDFEIIAFDDDSLRSRRGNLGYAEDEILIAYAGSNAKWQSFDRMIEFASNLLMSNPKVRVLLFTKENEFTQSILNKFPGRVSCKWLTNAAVRDYLLICDYALMIRESSMTNWVSSPTKFAEYLACGLPLIANDSMAISNIITDNNAGIIIRDFSLNTPLELKRSSISEKARLHQVAIDLFSKKSLANHNKYLRVLK